MMELRIKITRENAEKVAQIIKEFVQIETGEIVTDAKPEAITPDKSSLSNYLSPPPELTDLGSGSPSLKTRAARHVGTWGQFNSFFPVKAVLRILCRMVSENGGKAVNLQELVDRSKDTFKMAGLGKKYRGFPSSNKESAVGRLVWHFITPANEMGLVKIEGAEEIPARGWGKVRISPTKEGLEFARINNVIFDAGGMEQVLTDSEREWMLDYLKKIDGQGYREYSFINEIFHELKKGNTDIASWLGKNQRFINYVKSWSSKTEDGKEFGKQIANVATMFAQSKIALLRELGVISDKRGMYQIIHELE